MALLLRATAFALRDLQTPVYEQLMLNACMARKAGIKPIVLIIRGL